MKFSDRRIVPPTSKRYKSAPITEAVIEIRLQPSPTFDLSILQSFADTLKGDFPTCAPMHIVEMGLTVAEQPDQAPAQSFSQTPMGLRLAKLDNSRIVQLRRDGLAYSHLAPYSDWPTFRAEALPLWQRYRAIFPDAKPTRCALRYINRVDIPKIPIEVYDYFALYPKIPEALPEQDTISMTLSVQMPQRDIDCMAVINQIQVAPGKPDHISFVLDIDIFRLGIESWGDADVWTFLDKLRDRKNEIFEACITDQTRDLIDR